MRVYFKTVRVTAFRYEYVDGKKRRRQKTFTQTENPFNKNADGSVKTPAQIYASVLAEAAAWKDQSWGIPVTSIRDWSITSVPVVGLTAEGN